MMPEFQSLILGIQCKSPLSTLQSEELIGILADDLLPIEVAQSRRTLIDQVLVKKTMVRFEDERDGRWFDTVAYPCYKKKP
ncbi:MAG: hypothetical protein M0Q91_14340 [Methanoregula sp.]|jgi:hypothetical protein|nr:hypothetical protein [Methanoregula sp.]